MKKPQFVNSHIYHIYNRGVEKRKTFLDEIDHLRFIHDLFEFNDINPAISSNVRFTTNQPSKINTSCLNQLLEVQLPKVERKQKRFHRKLVIEILAFCLMPNHYHLLVRQLVDNGIVKFMQKLGTGYTNYFNLKYERVGPLFQGRFKAVRVAKESHLLHLPNYIHFNPLELIMPKLKDDGMKDYKKAIVFLENYRWSSFPDYIGKKNFPSITQRDFLSEMLGAPKNYKINTEKWLAEMNVEEITHLTLE